MEGPRGGEDGSGRACGEGEGGPQGPDGAGDGRGIPKCDPSRGGLVKSGPRWETAGAVRSRVGGREALDVQGPAVDLEMGGRCHEQMAIRRDFWAAGRTWTTLVGSDLGLCEQADGEVRRSEPGSPGPREQCCLENRKWINGPSGSCPTPGMNR